MREGSYGGHANAPGEPLRTDLCAVQRCAPRLPLRVLALEEAPQLCMGETRRAAQRLESLPNIEDYVEHPERLEGLADDRGDDLGSHFFEVQEITRAALSFFSKWEDGNLMAMADAQLPTDPCSRVRTRGDRLGAWRTQGNSR